MSIIKMLMNSHYLPNYFTGKNNSFIDDLKNKFSLTWACLHNM
jgi:hypothetical protein